MNRPCRLYGLASTEDGVIRYIGQTIYTVDQRFAAHTRAAKRIGSRGHNVRSANWIRDCWSRGFKVFPVWLCDGVLHKTEIELIEAYRADGFDLVNSTDGGEGNQGYQWTPEQIKKISRIRRGRVITPQWRKNIGDGQRGKVWSQESRAKLSATNKGKKKSPEHIEKIAAARRGSKWSDEQRAALSKSLTGRVFTEQHKANMRIARRAYAAKKAAESADAVYS